MECIRFAPFPEDEQVMPDRSVVIDRPRPLVEGEHLDQPTFHARYQAMPPGTRAELIGGVVYMPGPAGIEHGRGQVPAIIWLSYYAENTPGVSVLGHATAILGWRSEPQPDVMLRILPEHGGQTRDEKSFVHGAPELVVEVSKTTRYIDLGPKLADYEQAGVQEYVVHALDPDEVHWYKQQGGSLVRVAPDGDGLYRSAFLPGLWLDPEALLRGDTRTLRQVLDRGLATPEHQAFVAALAARAAGAAPDHPALPD
jgi:Uma2 family endonuclease